MTEEIKFSPEELGNIKKLQEEFNRKMFEFGQLYLRRMELDSAFKDLIETEKKIQEDYSGLQKQETDLLAQLTQKYGEGQLNINDGTFIPSPKSS